MDLRRNIEKKLWLNISENYEEANYSNAILDSIHMLTQIIKSKTGLELDGSRLVEKAFSGDIPKIRINKLQTKYEKSIQKGIQEILRGIYIAIRDPRNHNKFSDRKEDADAIIYFVNYLFKIIDSSESAFEEEAYLNRVFDKYYVKSEEYSKLLVKQIPDKEKINIAIKIVLKIDKGDIYALQYFMKVLLEELDTDDKKQLFNLISDLLKLTDNYPVIRSLLYIIPGEYWVNIDRVVGIRLDNILQSDVKMGMYDLKNDILCDDSYGALGTWITKEHLKSFCNIEEWTNLLVDKLESNNEYEIQYVLKYFWDILCDINYEIINKRLIKYFKNQLRADNKEIIERFLYNIMFNNIHPWWDVFKEELDGYSDILYVDRIEE